MTLQRTQVSADPDTPDATLVARTRAGEAAALGALYERHGGALLALARRLLGNDADAEDVLHDVFLGLPEALRHYEERGALGAWLRRVTARVALNRLRARERTRETSLDVHDAHDVHDVHGAHEARGAHDADALHDALSLEAAVAALPDTLRVVLVLHEIAGLPHADVARLLDITPGASEVRLHRAIRALRLSLGTR